MTDRDKEIAARLHANAAADRAAAAELAAQAEQEEADAVALDAENAAATPPAAPQPAPVPTDPTRGDGGGKAPAPAPAPTPPSTGPVTPTPVTDPPVATGSGPIIITTPAGEVVSMAGAPGERVKLGASPGLYARYYGDNLLVLDNGTKDVQAANASGRYVVKWGTAEPVAVDVVLRALEREPIVLDGKVPTFTLTAAQVDAFEEAALIPHCGVSADLLQVSTDQTFETDDTADTPDEMGQPGAARSIGWLPANSIIALFKRTPDAIAACIADGLESTSWDIHYTGDDGSPVPLGAFPDWTTNNGSLGTDPTSPRHPDVAHQPALAYAPMLIAEANGNAAWAAFFRDEVLFWNSYTGYWAQPGARDGANHIKRPDGGSYQVRGAFHAISHDVQGLDAASNVPTIKTGIVRSLEATFAMIVGTYIKGGYRVSTQRGDGLPQLSFWPFNADEGVNAQGWVDSSNGYQEYPDQCGVAAWMHSFGVGIPFLCRRTDSGLSPEGMANAILVRDFLYTLVVHTLGARWQRFPAYGFPARTQAGHWNTAEEGWTAYEAARALGKPTSDTMLLRHDQNGEDYDLWGSYFGNWFQLLSQAVQDGFEGARDLMAKLVGTETYRKNINSSNDFPNYKLTPRGTTIADPLGGSTPPVKTDPGPVDPPAPVVQGIVDGTAFTAVAGVYRYGVTLEVDTVNIAGASVPAGDHFLVFTLPAGPTTVTPLAMGVPDPCYGIVKTLTKVDDATPVTYERPSSSKPDPIVIEPHPMAGQVRAVYGLGDAFFDQLTTPMEWGAMVDGDTLRAAILALGDYGEQGSIAGITTEWSAADMCGPRMKGLGGGHQGGSNNGVYEANFETGKITFPVKPSYMTNADWVRIKAWYNDPSNPKGPWLDYTHNDFDGSGLFTETQGPYVGRRMSGAKHTYRAPMLNADGTKLLMPPALYFLNENRMEFAATARNMAPNCLALKWKGFGIGINFRGTGSDFTQIDLETGTELAVQYLKFDYHGGQGANISISPRTYPYLDGDRILMLRVDSDGNPQYVPPFVWQVNLPLVPGADTPVLQGFPDQAPLACSWSQADRDTMQYQTYAQADGKLWSPLHDWSAELWWEPATNTFGKAPYVGGLPIAQANAAYGRRQIYTRPNGKRYFVLLNSIDEPLMAALMP